jgi:hypothetical protein
MKTQLVVISILILAFFAGCKKENELKKSVYISDPEFIELPEYSEWGYNTFGAYYDRDVFISNNDLVPAKVFVTDTSMSFILDGQKGQSDYYYSGYTEMTMTFTLSGFAAEGYADLTALDDSILDLSDDACRVQVSIDTMTCTASILSGELIFKRVQNLHVDTQPVEAILSGYFEFKALINGKPVTISEGRFDVGISPDNFYSY